MTRRRTLAAVIVLGWAVFACKVFRYIIDCERRADRYSLRYAERRGLH